MMNKTMRSAMVTRTPPMFPIYTAIILNMTAPLPMAYAHASPSILPVSQKEIAVNRVTNIEQTRIPNLLSKSCDYRQTMDGIVGIVDQIEETLSLYEEGKIGDDANIDSVLNNIDDQLTLIEKMCDESK